MSPTFVAGHTEIALTHAVITDLPVLAELNRLAYLPEMIAQIAFANWPDEANMHAVLIGRIKERFDHPGTQRYRYYWPCLGTCSHIRFNKQHETDLLFERK